ncbi:lysophospholipid acyltransferase family protein [Roseateles sp. DC23W]|uniref:lysophospholipid acyltransferase family protein n=1 Tax=Pelomonas dachongensis TaxID=3299029 RepID=UPI00374A1686
MTVLRWLGLPLQWLALQHMLLFLGLGSLLWNAVALVLYPLLPRDTGRRVGRAGIAAGYRVFWWMARTAGMMRLHSEPLDALRDEGGLIVVANHPSMLDAMMLVARLPRSACIMKASLMRNPLLAPGARLARYLRNDSPRGLVRLAVQDLRQGGQLVLFPEGTRTTQPPVNSFRGGVCLIAKRAGAPIQTVFIDTSSPYLCKGWPLWRLPPLPIVFTVRLGQRFEPAHDPAAQLRELEAYFASGVRQTPLHDPHPR